MVSSDQDIVDQALSYVDYDTVYTDVEVQEIVEIGKEEIRAHLGQPSLTFYATTPDWVVYADRALFWFTVIGLKVRAHEIASVNLTVSSIRSTAYTGGKFTVFFENFDKHLASAELSIHGGAALTNISRDDRTYGDT